jgi:hypothetical protein
MTNLHEPCAAPMHYGVCKLPKGHAGKHSRKPFDLEHVRQQVDLARKHAEVIADFFQDHGFTTRITTPGTPECLVALTDVHRPDDAASVIEVWSPSGRLEYVHVLPDGSLKLWDRDLLKLRPLLEEAGLGAWLPKGRKVRR